MSGAEHAEAIALRGRMVSEIRADEDAWAVKAAWRSPRPMLSASLPGRSRVADNEELFDHQMTAWTAGEHV
jgi:hypothetical protein